MSFVTLHDRNNLRIVLGLQRLMTIATLRQFKVGRHLEQIKKAVGDQDELTSTDEHSICRRQMWTLASKELIVSYTPRVQLIFAECVEVFILFFYTCETVRASVSSCHCEKRLHG